jgi:hypothetical protein
MREQIIIQISLRQAESRGDRLEGVVGRDLVVHGAEPQLDPGERHVGGARGDDLGAGAQPDLDDRAGLGGGQCPRQVGVEEREVLGARADSGRDAVEGVPGADAVVDDRGRELRGDIGKGCPRRDLDWPGGHGVRGGLDDGLGDHQAPVTEQVRGEGLVVGRDVRRLFRGGRGVQRGEPGGAGGGAGAVERADFVVGREVALAGLRRDPVQERRHRHGGAVERGRRRPAGLPGDFEVQILGKEVGQVLQAERPGGGLWQGQLLSQQRQLSGCDEGAGPARATRGRRDRPAQQGFDELLRGQLARGAGPRAERR